MKKILILVLALILTAAVSVCGFAEGVEKTECRDFSSFFDADELSRVLSDVSGDTFTTETNAKEQQNGQSGEENVPYKRYNVTKDDFIYRLADGEKLADMISSEYSWIFPGQYTVAQADMREESKWHMTGYKEYTQEILDEGVVQKDTVDDNAVNAAIAKITSENSVEVEDVICVNTFAYRTDFVCVVTSDKTYLVPFGARPDFTGLENGAVYTPGEASEILLQTTDTIVDYDPNNGELEIGGFGVKLYRPKKHTINVLVLIFPAVAAVVTAIIVIFVVRFKKIKKV
ncbi:MAG: hypothetical protein K2J80_13790 [Oscillospiraceae bacterium]|nr:hypothetical protein [Oscillospiraceae bacterium]